MRKNNTLSLKDPVIAGVILFFVLLFVALHPYMAYDEALWSYIGRIWSNNGLPPYVESVENKTPGIFMLHAISERITIGNYLFVRIIGAISVLISSVFVYKIVKKIYNDFTAILAMYIFGLASCWVVLDGFSFAQVETFMILFSVIALYLIILAKEHKNFKSLMFLAGIALGLSVSFKQIAVTTCAVSLCLYFIYTAENMGNKLRVKGLLLVALGFIITILILCLILLVYGVSFFDYINGAWLILFNSGSTAPSLEFRFANFSRIFIFSRFIVFYPILIWVLIKYKSYKNKFFVVLILWLLLDFIGVNASGYYYGHQVKQILAPLAIISAIVLTTPLENVVFNKKFNITHLTILILTILLFFPFKHVVITGKKLLEREPLVYEELAVIINQNTLKDDYIYVFGADIDLIRTLAISNRLASSKYFSSIFITSDTERDIVYEDLEMKPPIFVLKEANIPISEKIYGDNTISYIEQNYSKYKIVDNFEILKRNF